MATKKPKENTIRHTPSHSLFSGTPLVCVANRAAGLATVAGTARKLARVPKRRSLERQGPQRIGKLGIGGVFDVWLISWFTIWNVKCETSVSIQVYTIHTHSPLFENVHCCFVLWSPLLPSEFMIWSFWTRRRSLLLLLGACPIVHVMRLRTIDHTGSFQTREKVEKPSWAYIHDAPYVQVFYNVIFIYIYLSYYTQCLYAMVYRKKNRNIWHSSLCLTDKFIQDHLPDGKKNGPAF